MWSFLRPASRRVERERARDAIRRLSIRTPDEEATVGTLSGGNQQKVVLARALSRDPRVLLLDEPTRGVDVGAREEIYKIIGEMAGRGVAVLVVSSDMPEVLGLADRILVLAEGAVAGEVSREDATEERILLLGAGGG
jgi:ABC-type sugar transport system ATPase subunit